MASQTIAVQKEIPTTVRLSEYLKSEKGYAMDGNEILREAKKANLDLDQNSLNFQSGIAKRSDANEGRIGNEHVHSSAKLK
jgi:hypothetical protein